MTASELRDLSVDELRTLALMKNRKGNATATALQAQRVLCELAGVERRRDIDNYAPKMILDGLVAAGMIEDDRADWVRVGWRFEKGTERKTIIDIAEIQA